MRNPKFDAALEQMRRIHDSKNEDYAADDNPYSNFEEAAETAGITVEQQFLSLIGVKLARLRQLLAGKTPNHESVDDTLLDLAVYATLLYSYGQPVEGGELPATDKAAARIKQIARAQVICGQVYTVRPVDSDPLTLLCDRPPLHGGEHGHPWTRGEA